MVKKDSVFIFMILKITIYVSILIQTGTGIFNYYIVSDHLPTKEKKELSLLFELLWMGLFVQLVEGIFYIWLVNHYKHLTNMTAYRYYDWFITTPTMLVVFIVFLIFLNNLPNNKTKKIYKLTDIVTISADGEKHRSLIQIIESEKYTLIPILILNALMLLFGYLGEMGIMNMYVTVMLGFVFFGIYFYIIYEKYAKHTTRGETIFWFLITIWGLYGIAALLPYIVKNICYNILDLFSKNFFECYLGYILWYNVKLV